MTSRLWVPPRVIGERDTGPVYTHVGGVGGWLTGAATLPATPTADTVIFAMLGQDSDSGDHVPTLTGFQFYVVGTSRNATNVQRTNIAIGVSLPYYTGAYGTAFFWDHVVGNSGIAVMMGTISGTFLGRVYARADTATGSQASVTVTAPTQVRDRGGLAIAAAMQDSGGAGVGGMPASPWVSQSGGGLHGIAVYQFPSGVNDYRPAPTTCTFTNATPRSDNWSAMMVFVE